MNTLRNLSGLIRDLSHADSSRRRAAAETLAGADERAVYPLIRTLRDGNPGVQEAAMRSLVAIGGEVVAYMTIPLLRERALLRNTAVLILRELGRVSVPLLYPLLGDRDDDIRKFAVELLADIREDVDARCLVPLLGDPNENVRASAAKALGSLMGGAALPHLYPLLRDSEWVCFSALEAIANLRDSASVGPVLSLLDSPSGVLRYAAIETLGSIGSHEAVEPLSQYLPRVEGIEKTATVKTMVQIGITPSVSGIEDVLADLFRNGDWEERMLALRGMAAMGSTDMIADIIDIAGTLDPSDPESEDLLREIREAVRSFGCSTAIIGVLGSPGTKFRGRVIAIDIAGEMRCDEAVPHLVRLLGEDIRDVRRACIRALGKINNEDCREALLGALADGDGHVRQVAATALGTIGVRSAFEPLLGVLKKEKFLNVQEDVVRALLLIDAPGLFALMDGFSGPLKQMVAKFCNDAGVLLRLSFDEDAPVRVAAVTGLGRFSLDVAGERLRDALHDMDPDVRKAAVMAMAGMRCCREDIAPALHDSEMWVRLYAVKAMGRIATPEDAAVLEPMLRDPAPPVVLSAIDVLKGLGGEGAMRALASHEAHADPAIREKIAEALGGP